MRTPDDEAVSILFGKARITREFYGAESRKRPRDLAQEGAQRLRAANEASDDAPAADRPGELVGGGVR